MEGSVLALQVLEWVGSVYSGRWDPEKTALKIGQMGNYKAAACCAWVSLLL